MYLRRVQLGVCAASNSAHILAYVFYHANGHHCMARKPDMATDLTCALTSKPLCAVPVL